MKDALLLDSSVLIPLSHGRDNAGGLRGRRARLVLCHTTIGEFLAGLEDPTHRRTRASAAWFEAFRSQIDRVATTDETAAGYARLYRHTRGIGRPIPSNDLWIAATAVEHAVAAGDRGQAPLRMKPASL